MVSLIATVHLIVAVVLVFLVLIQDSKGAMGGMLGGGGSNTLFGASGASSFIVKLTRYVAVVFAGTCIALTIMSTNSSTSVVDDFVAPPVDQVETATDAPAATTETQKEENAPAN